MGESPELNVYQQLGVKTVINAAGTLTVLGGSLMAAETVAAFASAAKHFVKLQELQDKVGERIAALLKVEAALVTSGAASAMQLGTAAALTGGDPEKAKKLPDLVELKSEVLIQKSHHEEFDHQITNCGVKLIDVETVEDLQSAINERTAMMLFYNLHEPAGKIDRLSWVQVARQHGIPTLLDAAADIPPLSTPADNLKLGFDMVAVSGGKALGGPNDTGLLLGSKKIIDAAKLNASPNCLNIGRGMKVGKEDMVALWAAIERYARLDHAAEHREWDRRIGVIEAAVRTIPSVTTERVTPPIANHVPHLVIDWDRRQIRIDRDHVMRKMEEGDPPIILGRVHDVGDSGLLVSVFQLKEDEEQIVATRLHDVLMQARR